MSLVLVVVALTTAAASLPAYWLMRLALEGAASAQLAGQQALGMLLLGTLVAVGLGAALAERLARQVTGPLAQLTQATKDMSQGNSTAPLALPAAPREVAALAAAFEASRSSTGRLVHDLTQATEWSDALLQSIVEGIVTLDEAGRITSFSDGAERVTGWKAEEVLGQPISEVLPLSDGDGQLTDQMPPAGGVTEIAAVTRNGREVILAATCARLRLPGDQTTQWALVLRDTTNEEAARRLRSYFLANISHEFRTPLSALNASIQLLLEEVEDLSPAQIVELLSSVRLSVSGLQNLIDNLLESASIEAGRFRIRQRETEPDEVLAEAIRVMQPLLDRRHQTLCLHKPAHLPLVSVDPTRLTQVWVNLLSNASKYGPPESSIELSLDVAGEGGLCSSVADRGPGIPPAERAHLFRQFVRLSQPDGAQYGIGLGLSVVKAIVEGHGGQVGVEDRPGGGVVFWFKIPLNRQTA
jgi:PAS domain S-box-containing protein